MSTAIGLSRMAQVPQRRWVILSLVFLAQAVVARVHNIEADLIHLLWGAVLLIITSGSSLAKLLAHPAWRREWPWWVGAMLAAIWLGMVQLGSVAPARGLYATWVWWMALLYVPVARLAWREQWAGRMLLALLLPGFLVALSRSWKAFGHELGYWVVGLDPNMLADRLLLGTLLLLLGVAWFAQAGSGPVRLPLYRGLQLLLAVWVLLLAVILQQVLEARAVMLALPVALLAVALLLGRAWLWALPALACAVFVLVWLDPDRWAVGASATMADLQRFQGIEAEQAVTSRFRLWSAALALLPLGWLSGTGLHSFAVLFPPLRASGDRTAGTFVHNDWLQLAFETGLPFVLMLVVLVGLFLRAFLHLWVLRFRGQLTWPQQLGVIAGLMAGLILAHAIINFPLYDPTLLSVALVGMLLCISAAQSDEPEAEPGPSLASTPRRFAAVGLVMLALLVWLPSMGHALAWALLREHPIFPGVGAATLSDEQHYRWSAQLRTLGLGYGVPAFMQAGWAAQFYHLAEGRAQREWAELAVMAYEEARAAQPWQTDFDLAYVRFLHSTGMFEFEVRQVLLEDVIRRNPTVPGPWLEWARQLDEEGLWLEAAPRLLPSWLPHCFNMASVDHDEFTAFFRMIPQHLHDDSFEFRYCQSLVRRPLLQRLQDGRR